MKMPIRAKRSIAAAAAAALVLPMTVSVLAPAAAATVLVDRGWPPYPGSGNQPYGYVSPDATSASLDTTDATAEQSAGLVTITSEVEFGAGEAAGSGIVIGSDGLVVTNHHVVEGATSISVTVVGTGETYDAEVLGSNAKRDVAVLQLDDASGLTTVETDPGGVAVGDDVTAVGDAGGDGGALTAAAGTVTDTDRPITVSDEQTGEAHRLTQLIEVDADIIAGDSGGALLESDGDVVGMNVAASSGSADITGYVIPIQRVLRIAAHVIAGEETASITLGYDAFLGVSLAGTGTALAGVVDGGAAWGAGLGAGDTITSLGGTEVTTYLQLQKAVAAHDPDDSVRVTWTDTSGAAHSATVTLGRAPVA